MPAALPDSEGCRGLGTAMRTPTYELTPKRRAKSLN